MGINQTVLEAKRYGIFSCEQTKTLRTAAQQLVAEDVGALVITDAEGYLTGIITRTDLIRALLTHPDWQEKPIKDFMIREVVTVPAEASLLEVAKLVLEKHIHRVVVVREEEGKKRPLSVVSAADVVYHMVKEI